MRNAQKCLEIRDLRPETTPARETMRATTKTAPGARRVNDEQWSQGLADTALGGVD